MTPTHSSAGGLICAAADGDGVANGLHDVLAVARGRVLALGGVRLSNDLRRGRWWLAGKSSGRGVPG